MKLIVAVVEGSIYMKIKGDKVDDKSLHTQTKIPYCSVLSVNTSHGGTISYKFFFFLQIVGN